LEPDDLELVRRATRGDGAAFHVLVDRHAPELFRLAASLSATRADAEDVVQETLIGAYQSLKRFDARASVRTWLKRILVRQAARHWNKAKRGRSMVSIDAAEMTPASRDNGRGPISVDRRHDVAAVIKTLAPEHRMVVVMREFEQMSYAEIAQVLEVPIGTVESRLHRARAELKTKLQDYAD
jgi:RNA polymerase sigma-70 factor (ECF subfamily)